MPDVEPIQPIQDLVDQAFGERPELANSRINLENSQIQLVGSRNGLLPTLSGFVELTNHAQAGNVNGLPLLDSMAIRLVSSAVQGRWISSSWADTGPCWASCSAAIFRIIAWA